MQRKPHPEDRLYIHYVKKYSPQFNSFFFFFDRTTTLTVNITEKKQMKLVGLTHEYRA